MAFARVALIATSILAGALAGQAENQFLRLPLQDATLNVYNGWIYRGSEKKHRAVDYKTARSTMVYASADGLAISSCQPPLANSDPSKDTYGQFVFMVHPNGYTTLYAHLDTILLPLSSATPNLPGSSTFFNSTLAPFDCLRNSPTSFLMSFSMILSCNGVQSGGRKAALHTSVFNT